MSDLCTIEDVRTYLGVESTEHDVLLSRLITACSSEIERWCGQPLLAEEGNVVYHFGGSGASLLLPYFPIVGVVSLTYVTGLGEAPVTVDAETVGVTRGALISTGGFGAYEYTATLTVGYATIPADITQVCIEMVTLRAKESLDPKIGAGRLGKRSEGKSVAGVNMSTVYERPDWAARLAPYRVLSV